MLSLIVLITVIQQTISMSCEDTQMGYKTTFISNSDSYTPIDNNSLIRWFYQKFSKMNIQFPWDLIGQQLNEMNKTSFLTNLTLKLISHNSWIFVIVFILIFVLIIFIISSIKSFCKYKRNQRIIPKQSFIKNNHQPSWINEFEQEKYRIYSHALHTLQSAINNAYHSKKKLACRLFYKCIYSIFFICLLLTSGLLLLMIVIITEGITIEKQIRDFIENSSLELISFIEHTAFITNCFFQSIDDQFKTNSELKLATKGVAFLMNILSDLSIRLKNLEKLFDLWFIIRLISIITVAIFLLLSGFVVYLLITKLHWSRVKSFQYTNIAFILSIVYWFGFILWFSKLIILLPHVAGACSACHDLKQKQVYNPLLFASRWFNSTFLLAMDNEPIDIDRLIGKCEDNSALWSINDFIRLALLENKLNMNETDYIDKQYYPTYSKYERHFGHCQILHDLNNNFTHLFCYVFIKHLLHYLITSIVAAISHFVLYLLTILLRRFIQNHTYRFDDFNSSIRSSPIVTADRSMIKPFNQNKKHDEMETNEYQNLSTIV